MFEASKRGKKARGQSVSQSTCQFPTRVQPVVTPLGVTRVSVFRVSTFLLVPS